MQLSSELIRKIKQANRMTVLTGAGVSKESGIPTFREAQTGLWEQYDPNELASPIAFKKNPKLVWDWYEWRRDLIRKSSPNPAHFALAEFEKLVPEFTLITQNVDGLHALAGSQNLIEIHGNIMRTICFENRHRVTQWSENSSSPPTCPKCGSLLRPDVVWFGENLPAQALENSYKASSNGDVFISIGTSGLVQPAAHLPFLALKADALVIEINPEKTPLTEFVSFCLKGPAGNILPKLIKQIWG